MRTGPREALILAVFLGCGGGGGGGTTEQVVVEKPTAEECDKVGDRALTIMGQTAVLSREKQAEREIEAWKKKQLRSPLRKAIVEECKKSLSKDDVGCVLKAKDERALATCLHYPVEEPKK